MSAHLKFGDTFPWVPFHSDLTEHDRTVIAELAKHERTSPEKANARIGKLKANLADRKALTAGKRWNSLKAKWESNVR